MTTHVVTMRDGSEYRITDAQATQVTAAIDAGRNFYLNNDYLNYHEVRSVKRVQNSLEVQVLRLDQPKDNGMQPISARREEAVAKIRATLSKSDHMHERKRQYFANLQLAQLLHGHEPSFAKWGLERWEQFAKEHPDPAKECEVWEKEDGA